MTQAPEIEKTTRRKAVPAPVAPTKATSVPKQKPQAPTFPAGGPRVDLLPPIVEVRRKQNATLRLLMLGLVGIVAIAIVASLAVWVLAMGAERALSDEQNRTPDLLLEQAKYDELIDVKAQLADYEYVDLATLYPEADWARIMRELDGALPAGVALTTEGITVKGLTTEAAASGDANAVVVDAPGVIEVRFTASAPTFDSPTPLLNGLQALTGYVSANVSAVANSAEDGYMITGTVQLGAPALGGTTRTGNLDQEQLKALQEALFEVATAPPATAPAEGTGESTTEGSTGTGQ